MARRVHQPAEALRGEAEGPDRVEAEGVLVPRLDAALLRAGGDDLGEGRAG
jgi:hypothetical protein